MNLDTVALSDLGLHADGRSSGSPSLSPEARSGHHHPSRRAHGADVIPTPESFGLSSRVNGSAWAAPPTNVDAAEMTGRLSTAQATRQHRLSGTSVKPSRHKAQHERFDYGPTSKSHIRATKTGHVNPADYEWQQFDEDDVPLATQPLYLVSNPKLRNEVGSSGYGRVTIGKEQKPNYYDEHGNLLPSAPGGTTTPVWKHRPEFNDTPTSKSLRERAESHKYGKKAAKPPEHIKDNPRMKERLPDFCSADPNMTTVPRVQPPFYISAAPPPERAPRKRTAQSTGQPKYLEKSKVVMERLKSKAAPPLSSAPPPPKTERSKRAAKILQQAEAKGKTQKYWEVTATDHAASRQKKLKETAAKIELERQQALLESSLIATRKSVGGSAGPTKARSGPSATVAASAFSDAGLRASKSRKKNDIASLARRVEAERQEALMKSSIIVQRRLRREEHKEKQRCERAEQKRRESAALTIQAAYRGVIGRRATDERRKVVEAEHIAEVQRLQAEAQAREAAQQREARRASAAGAAKARAAKAAVENNAATTIQSAFRGAMVRERLKKENFERQIRSAIIIQSWIRRVQATRRVQQRRAEVNTFHALLGTAPPSNSSKSVPKRNLHRTLGSADTNPRDSTSGRGAGGVAAALRVSEVEATQKKNAALRKRERAARKHASQAAPIPESLPTTDLGRFETKTQKLRKRREELERFAKAAAAKSSSTTFSDDENATEAREADVSPQVVTQPLPTTDAPDGRAHKGRFATNVTHELIVEVIEEEILGEVVIDTVSDRVLDEWIADEEKVVGLRSLADRLHPASSSTLSVRTQLREEREASLQALRDAAMSELERTKSETESHAHTIARAAAGQLDLTSNGEGDSHTPLHTEAPVVAAGLPFGESTSQDLALTSTKTTVVVESSVAKGLAQALAGNDQMNAVPSQRQPRVRAPNIQSIPLARPKSQSKDSRSSEKSQAIEIASVTTLLASNEEATETPSSTAIVVRAVNNSGAKAKAVGPPTPHITTHSTACDANRVTLLVAPAANALALCSGTSTMPTEQLRPEIPVTQHGVTAAGPHAIAIVSSEPERSDHPDTAGINETLAIMKEDELMLESPSTVSEDTSTTITSHNVESISFATGDSPSLAIVQSDVSTSSEAPSTPKSTRALSNHAGRRNVDKSDDQMALVKPGAGVSGPAPLSTVREIEPLAIVKTVAVPTVAQTPPSVANQDLKDEQLAIMTVNESATLTQTLAAPTLPLVSSFSVQKHNVNEVGPLAIVSEGISATHRVPSRHLTASTESRVRSRRATADINKRESRADAPTQAAGELDTALPGVVKSDIDARSTAPKGPKSSESVAPCGSTAEAFANEKSDVNAPRIPRSRIPMSERPKADSTTRVKSLKSAPECPDSTEEEGVEDVGSNSLSNSSPAVLNSNNFARSNDDTFATRPTEIRKDSPPNANLASSRASEEFDREPRQCLNDDESEMWWKTTSFSKPQGAKSEPSDSTSSKLNSHFSRSDPHPYSKEEVASQTTGKEIPETTEKEIPIHVKDTQADPKKPVRRSADSRARSKSRASTSAVKEQLSLNKKKQFSDTLDNDPPDTSSTATSQHFASHAFVVSPHSEEPPSDARINQTELTSTMPFGELLASEQLNRTMNEPTGTKEDKNETVLAESPSATPKSHPTPRNRGHEAARTAYGKAPHEWVRLAHTSDEPGPLSSPTEGGSDAEGSGDSTSGESYTSDSDYDMVGTAGALRVDGGVKRVPKPRTIRSLSQVHVDEVVVATPLPPDTEPTPSSPEPRVTTTEAAKHAAKRLVGIRKGARSRASQPTTPSLSQDPGVTEVEKISPIEATEKKSSEPDLFLNRSARLTSEAQHDRLRLAKTSLSQRRPPTRKHPSVLQSDTPTTLTATEDSAANMEADAIGESNSTSAEAAAAQRRKQVEIARAERDQRKRNAEEKKRGLMTKFNRGMGTQHDTQPTTLKKTLVASTQHFEEELKKKPTQTPVGQDRGWLGNIATVSDPTNDLAISSESDRNNGSEDDSDSDVNDGNGDDLALSFSDDDF